MSCEMWEGCNTWQTQQINDIWSASLIDSWVVFERPNSEKYLLFIQTRL